MKHRQSNEYFREPLPDVFVHINLLDEISVSHRQAVLAHPVRQAVLRESLVVGHVVLVEYPATCAG